MTTSKTMLVIAWVALPVVFTLGAILAVVLS